MWKKSNKQNGKKLFQFNPLTKLRKFRTRIPIQSLGLLIIGIISSTVIYTNCSSSLNPKHSSQVQYSENSESPSDINHFLANDGEIIGNVERLVDQGSTLLLSGWACIVGNDSTRISLEIGAQGGDRLGNVSITSSREDAVKNACHSSKYEHGFSFSISKEARDRNSGKEIYVKFGNTTIPQNPGLIITAIPSTPIAPTVIGFLDQPSFDPDRGLITAKGWACVQGRDDQLPVNILVLINGGVSTFSGVANLDRGTVVQNACGSSSSYHGFIIRAQLDEFYGSISTIQLSAEASFNGTPTLLQGKYTFKDNNRDKILPYTDILAPWTGSGGSSWSHRVTLKSITSGSSSQFSIYSSSFNTGLNPNFYEQIRDISVPFNGGCYEVGNDKRTSISTGDLFEVHTRACFERKDTDGYNWDISFDHAALNLTKVSQGQISNELVYGASHGTLQLRAK